jgi:hypothetical protein
MVLARTRDPSKKMVFCGLANLKEEDIRLLNMQGAWEPCLGGNL